MARAQDYNAPVRALRAPAFMTIGTGSTTPKTSGPQPPRMQPTFTANVCGLKEPAMSIVTTIQTTPSWQLRASVTPVRDNQHHLMVTSLVPTARRPEEHVRCLLYTSPSPRD